MASEISTDQRSLEVAWRLCRRALSEFRDSKELPREGLVQEYAHYKKDWCAVKAYQNAGEIEQATKIAWKIAIKRVLANPKVMVFYLKGAFQAWADLVQVVGRSLEGEDEWRDIIHYIAVFEEFFAQMVSVDGEVESETLFKMATSHDFENHLETIFARQRRMLTNSGQMYKVYSTRKNTLYAAMNVFARCRWIMKHENDKPEENELAIVPSQEDKARENKLKKMRKEAKRAADRQRTLRTKGSTEDLAKSRSIGRRR